MLKLCLLLCLLYLSTAEGNANICGSKADVVFLLDSSHSIGQHNFTKVKDFVKGVVTNLDVADNKVQVGVVTYSSSVNTEFHLNTFTSKNDVKEGIESIAYRGKGTNTGEALQHVTDNEFSEANGHRPGVPKILVLITDGVSSNPNTTAEAAAKAKAAGIKIYVLGIDFKGNIDELIMIASSKDWVDTVEGYNLDNYESVVPAKICTNFSDRSNCRNIHNADIAFLLDMSGGIGQSNFNKMKDFVKNITKQFEVGHTRVQFAVVTFSTFAENVFHLKDYNNTADIDKAIDDLNYVPGDSHTHLGLQYLRENTFTEQSGARGGNVDKVALVITEGYSNRRQNTTAEATELKKAGVTVFAINVGGSMDLSELKAIATDEEGDDTQYVFKTLTFDLLQELEPLVLKMVCVRAALPSCMGKADVVFLLDSSCSIGKQNFAKMKQFVKLVTHEFYVHKQGIQVGVETFECKRRVLLRLNSNHDKVNIKHKITSLEYTPGGTNTGEALEKLRTESFSKAHGTREKVKKIGILVTDGDSKSPSKTFYEAHNARREGIKLVVVGVGEDPGEMAGIASRADPKVESYLFLAKTFDTLTNYVRNVSSIVCSV